MKNIYLTIVALFVLMASNGQDGLVFVKLNINSGSNSYTTDVYFNDNASRGFDFGFDAQFFGAVPAFSIYSLLVEGDIGEPYVLQAVNTEDLADVTIPIGVNANQNEQLTFTLLNSTLPPTTEVYLEDTLTSTTTSLNSSDYVITPATALSGTGRFFLRITDPTLVTYTYDGAWSPNDPSGITTVGNNLEIISGDATISASTTVNAITIAPGTSLLISDGTLTAEAITLNSTSTSYAGLIQKTSSNIVANTITYERFVNSNAGGNDLVAAPVMGQTWSDFLSDNSATLLNDGNTNPTAYAFAPFDKSTGDFENLNSSSSFALTNGIGYRAATNVGETVTFTGTYPTGDSAITVDITNGGPEYAQWNLVGNPYPSYINLVDFFNYEIGEELTNIDLFNTTTAGVYGYNGNGYDIINLSNVTARPLMAPGQGFFVSADPALVETQDLEFFITMQSVGDIDDFIIGRNSELVYLTLDINTENDYAKTEFYFNDNASLGLDKGYDAAVWGESVDGFGIYSHLVEENSGVPMGLQTLHSTQISNVSIPLGVHANPGEVLKFRISTSTLPETINVYLDDVVTNTATLLTTSNYILTPTSQLSSTGRFFLRFTEDALSIVDNVLNNLNIYSLQNTKELVISGQLRENTKLELFDMQGRPVLTTQLDTTLLENRIDTSSLSTGVYVVNIQNATQQKTQKVVLK